jgi:hypothetical protein
MEALDIDLVERVNRRNDALERVNSVRRGGLLSGHADRLAATHVEPIPDDETYAARFHRAYNRKDADQ